MLIDFKKKACSSISMQRMFKILAMHRISKWFDLVPFIVACEQAPQWGKSAKINQRARRAERRLGKRTVSLTISNLMSPDPGRAQSQLAICKLKNPPTPLTSVSDLFPLSVVVHCSKTNWFATPAMAADYSDTTIASRRLGHLLASLFCTDVASRCRNPLMFRLKIA